MSDKKKVVQFDFFTPYYSERDENGKVEEKILDLDRIFSELDTEIKYNYSIGLEDYMLQKYQKESATGIWTIQLLRSRESSPPGIYNERDSSYEYIKLEDGKKFAESTSIIYDPEDNLFMMQRNKFAVSHERCQDFLSSLCETRVLLKVRGPANNLKKIQKENRYRKIIMALDIDESTTVQDDSLGDILGRFARYNGKMLKIEISMGYLRDRELRSAEIVNLVNEAYKYPGTKKLQVRAAAPEDTEFDTIDLLADRQNMQIEVSYSTKNPITHERLIRVFRREYLENYRNERE